MKKADFSQRVYYTIQEQREKVRSALTNTLSGILHLDHQYAFPKNIAREVAQGIIDHGDMLVSNAETEPDQGHDDSEEDDNAEVNQMGDDFANLKDSALMVLELDSSTP